MSDNVLTFVWSHSPDVWPDNNPDIAPAAVMSLLSRVEANIFMYIWYLLVRSDIRHPNKDIDNED